MSKLTSAAIVISLVLAMFICGCQEQTQSNTKKDRLVGAENIRLKKELELCGEEIEKQIKLFEQCEQEKTQIQRDREKSLKFLIDRHTEAVKENDSLKTRIAELESQAAGP
jgi:hypothetical protein